MQELKVKKGDGSYDTVKIHRSFQDISGKHIFHHANGTFGYKDGSPVQNRGELDVIPEPHRRVALAWWKRVGEKMSSEYYGAIADTQREKAGDFQEELAAVEANTMLDSILYTRRPFTKGGKMGAVSDPKPWMEFGFNKRPDWWGQARQIDFLDFRYAMQDQIDQNSDPSASDKEGSEPKE
ncbi:MAG TPA: hypothetical protein DCG53_12890 [Syntrophus sp. (in: bacteria)]|jgi:hypothetical protein|nr:hypothetical protein [Syntrophus sp. (in: bacteria)]